MTPLISEMVRLSPEPERATWFDLGELTRTENQRVPVEVIMHLPFDKTAIVGIDKDGAKFALWLTSGDDYTSVTVSGCTADSVRKHHCKSSCRCTGAAGGAAAGVLGVACFGHTPTNRNLGAVV